MGEVRAIDGALLDAVSAQAAAGPRGRKNYNFHAADDAPAHRLLNAIEPGSYVAPHCHLGHGKDETFLVVRGRLGLVVFTSTGEVAQTFALAPLGADGGTAGVDIPRGTFHSVVALAPGTVFFEAKAGPYAPSTPEERAAWAPAEGTPEAAEYYRKLVALF